jgi:hypothetical protein
MAPIFIKARKSSENKATLALTKLSIPKISPKNATNIDTLPFYYYCG